MSNAFQSITTGAANLKNVYEGPILSQFNDDLPVYKNIQKEYKGWSGLAVVRSLKMRRNQGIGAGSDGGNLPSIGVQTNVQATINAKFNWLRFGITSGMIASSKNDTGSFVRQASYELNEGYNDLRADINRQISWSGRGDLCAVNTAAVGSTSLSIKGREAVETALKFVDVGMIVDIVSTAGVYKATGVTITATSGAATALTATLTLDTAVTCAADDILVRTGSYDKEIQGFLYTLDGGTTGEKYAINRATYQVYQGSVVDASSANLSLDLMKQAQVLGRRRGGAKIKAWWTDFDTERFYERLLVADKRFVNTMKGDGSFTTKENDYIDYGGAPIVADQSCPRRLFGIDPDAWKWYVLSEMKFADESGAMMIVQTDTDAFEVRIRFFANLFNQKPNACSTLMSYISP